MTEIIHACPPGGSGLMPCCGRTPFEVGPLARISENPDAVTCAGPGADCDHDSQTIDHEGVTYWACLKCGYNHGPVDGPTPAPAAHAGPCGQHCGHEAAATAPALTWAESIASHGSGPTATVDIDVNVPGEEEPAPLEIPLDAARTLHAMLGDLLAAAVPAPAPELRDLIAAAIHNNRFPDSSWDRQLPAIQDDYRTIADAVLAVRDTELQQLRAQVDRVRAIPRLPHHSQQTGDQGRAYTRGWESVINAILTALDQQEQA